MRRELVILLVLCSVFLAIGCADTEEEGVVDSEDEEGVIDGEGKEGVIEED